MTAENRDDRSDGATWCVVAGTFIDPESCPRHGDGEDPCPGCRSAREQRRPLRGPYRVPWPRKLDRDLRRMLKQFCTPHHRSGGRLTPPWLTGPRDNSVLRGEPAFEPPPANREHLMHTRAEPAGPQAAAPPEAPRGHAAFPLWTGGPSLDCRPLAASELPAIDLQYSTADAGLVVEPPSQVPARLHQEKQSYEVAAPTETDSLARLGMAMQPGEDGPARVGFSAEGLAVDAAGTTWLSPADAGFGIEADPLVEMCPPGQAAAPELPAGGAQFDTGLPPAEDRLEMIGGGGHVPY